MTLEAQMRDYLPVIAASPIAPGLFHAFGFSGNGFQLVPIVDAILSELVTDGGTRCEIASIGPEHLIDERSQHDAEAAEV